jgi:hypothetical protein
VIRELDAYILDASSPNVSNVITVKLCREKVGEFERLLKQLDTRKNRRSRLISQFSNLLKEIVKVPRTRQHVPEVEKRTVFFKIFTVVASREEKPTLIDNKDLKRVLNQLSQVLNFKSFTLDGISAMVAKEGSQFNTLRLTSEISEYDLEIHNILIQRNVKGERLIVIDKLVLIEYDSLVFSTNTSIEEDGYLVVGVTQIANHSDSLILVIHAKIG